MDKLERNQQIITEGLREVSRQSFWLGAAAGLLFGLIAGAAIGYNLGSPQTIVIPLPDGIEV